MVVAVLIGFRPTTGPVEWLAAAGLLVLAALAISWLSVALGMSAEERRDRQQPADVPDPPAVPEQRLRPDRLDAGRPRWFAEHQPFTPIIETLRGLLLGTPIGDSGAARRRLVRRDLGRRLPLGATAVRARSGVAAGGVGDGPARSAGDRRPRPPIPDDGAASPGSRLPQPASSHHRRAPLRDSSMNTRRQTGLPQIASRSRRRTTSSSGGSRSSRNADQPAPVAAIRPPSSMRYEARARMASAPAVRSGRGIEESADHCRGSPPAMRGRRPTGAPPAARPGDRRGSGPHRPRTPDGRGRRRRGPRVRTSGRPGRGACSRPTVRRRRNDGSRARPARGPAAHITHATRSVAEAPGSGSPGRAQPDGPGCSRRGRRNEPTATSPGGAGTTA